MLKQDILREAARLTRAGQLVETTLLLQRMLRAEPDAASGNTAPNARTVHEQPTVDAKANAIEEKCAPQLARGISVQPRKLPAFLDGIKKRSGLGLRGPIERAPPSTVDIVPDGARFIEGTYSNPAGSRAYKLFIPSRYHAAIGVHSGLACGAAIDLPTAFVAMRQGGGDESVILGDGPPVPTIVFHGDRDTTVHPNNGGQILEQSLSAMSTQKKVHRGRVPGGLAYTRTIHTDASGRGIFEHWNIHGAGHAWSGGSPAGSYTDPRGPDATREMLRFFLEHSLAQQPS